ncbi:hypothetical protein MHK_005327, partial [Candidatus Magnetomorum sp. HK-1]
MPDKATALKVLSELECYVSQYLNQKRGIFPELN